MQSSRKAVSDIPHLLDPRIPESFLVFCMSFFYMPPQLSIVGMFSIWSRLLYLGDMLAAPNRQKLVN